MGNMTKDIPSESERKYDHLFMDWVDETITGIEDKRCTRIAYTGEGLSDTYAWDERTQFGPENNAKFTAISLITEGFIHAKKVHSSFPHALYSATPMGNEQWVKTFLWFVSHVQQGDHGLSP